MSKYMVLELLVRAKDGAEVNELVPWEKVREISSKIVGYSPRKLEWAAEAAIQHQYSLDAAYADEYFDKWREWELRREEKDDDLEMSFRVTREKMKELGLSFHPHDLPKTLRKLAEDLEGN